MQRRNFVKVMAGTGGLVAVGGGSLVASCLAETTQPEIVPGAGGMLLHRARVVSPLDLTLTARRATAEIAPGVTSPIYTWDDGPIGSTIEARRGDRARILLRNEIDQPTIAHWHGLRPPQEADGHPRLAIPPGAEYRYDFTIDERAGLYWYHPHPHMRTANQTYFGLVGLLIVRDEVEDALGLPSGDREICAAFQDKRRDGSGRLVYTGRGPSMMEGFLGDETFANGVQGAVIEVESALHRVRILNGSNARIYRVALSNGAPLTLIGSDGGLLPAPIEVPYLDMGTGERADLLIDFSGLREGETVSLRSLEFPSPVHGGMGMGMMRGGMAGGLRQGSAVPMLDFVVRREVRERPRVPAALPSIPRLSRADADRQRV
ncbi:MAG TPA: multicopper oxidase domain-containing protein, partial [Longimicrobiaceae bacterium]|nr:multicopper oxidase domain-containing protein [Longimicrobiaceae bacterium]